MIRVIKSKWPIARKRLGGTSGDREDFSKNGRVASQSEEKNRRCKMEEREWHVIEYRLIEMCQFK